MNYEWVFNMFKWSKTSLKDRQKIYIKRIIFNYIWPIDNN